MPDEDIAEDAFDPVVELLDERSQRAVDEEILLNGLRQMRQGLAVAKVNKALAQAGLIPEDAPTRHPEQFEREIQRQRAGIVELEKLYRNLRDTGIAEKTLDTYEKVPAGEPLTAGVPMP